MALTKTARTRITRATIIISIRIRLIIITINAGRID